MEDKKPTIEECISVVKDLNKGVDASEESLKNRANWLYMVNRLDFWEDIPILIELIKYDDEKTKKQARIDSERLTPIHRNNF